VNRKHNQNDTWLTPPELLKALGKFDLDPCCPEVMPWRTAKMMVHQPKDGLEIKWRGRVWCNPPYSKPLLWIKKMGNHNDGVMLLPAKSPETVWGQEALNGCDAVLFLKGRLLFHYIDGTKSVGKWSPYMLLAYGADNVLSLKLSKLEGVLWVK
jgi:hypothetical protein